MNYVQMVDMELLMIAESDENVKNELSGADLTIVGDKAILEAAGVARLQRINETENGNFFADFLKKLYRGGYSVYLLGDTLEDTDALKKYLNDNFEHLKIVGQGIIDEESAGSEKLVNEINIVLPDVIISTTSSPKQEAFLSAHKNHICAKLWYGIGTQKPHNRKSYGLRKRWRRIVSSRIFHHKVNKFNNENL
ncbi:MAG: WecB/TagA/CpsF family glycosyltransferase [Eubacterium sp.]|nr:WecB/TagA/CpsF family glycosyltransferase [Eubacterium sp.]